ncbi:MAG: TlpA disulfide reductase family protein [Flavobacteriales bacterium]
MRYFIFTLFLLPLLSYAQNALNFGYIVEIQLNDRMQMQVSAELPSKDPKAAITIYNGKEVYQLSVKKRIGDTIVYQFPAQDAEWRVAFEKDFSEARGWWINYNKKVPVRYPIHLTNGILEAPAPSPQLVSLAGRWRVVFNPGTENEELMVGVFEQKIGHFVTGSFLSETGDYRYLHGYISGNNLHLQTYTGYWAFVVDATVQTSDQMQGVFYSGASYKASFSASRDANVQLRDESSLTYLVKRDQTVLLEDLIKINGKKTDIDLTAKNKLTIIQIMGTWCPNCLDETQMLLQLQKDYKAKGLQVMALAFEVGSDTKKQRSRLKSWIKAMEVNYPVYLAGTSSKDAASARFPMLNGIMSFPTTLLVDQQGKIIAIHTGFSGPATGQAYADLVKKFKQEIEGALAE